MTEELEITDYIDDLVCEIITELDELCYNKPECEHIPHMPNTVYQANGFSSVMEGWGGGFTPNFLEAAVESNLDTMRESFKTKYGLGWTDAYNTTDIGPNDTDTWQELAIGWEGEWISDSDEEVTYYASVEQRPSLLTAGEWTYKVMLVCSHSNHEAFTFISEQQLRDTKFTTELAKSLAAELLTSKD